VYGGSLEWWVDAALIGQPAWAISYAPPQRLPADAPRLSPDHPLARCQRTAPGRDAASKPRRRALSYSWGMCGRYALYGPISRGRVVPSDLELSWVGDLIESVNSRKPRYNFAPTQESPIVGLNADGDPHIAELRWGLVPFWAKDTKIGYKAINARAETVHEKPMFREAFKRRRCLVPANGYFEWKGDKPPKQPYFIHSPHVDLMLFAGLWETWRPEKDAEPLHTYTIVTGPPGIVSGDIHDRQPVILPPADWSTWLAGSVDDARALLDAAKEPPLEYYPVSKAVGTPKNDSEDLVEPVEA